MHRGGGVAVRETNGESPYCGGDALLNLSSGDGGSGHSADQSNNQFPFGQATNHQPAHASPTIHVLPPQRRRRWESRCVSERQFVGQHNTSLLCVSFAVIPSLQIPLLSIDYHSVNPAAFRIKQRLFNLPILDTMFSIFVTVAIVPTDGALSSHRQRDQLCFRWLENSYSFIVASFNEPQHV